MPNFRRRPFLVGVGVRVACYAATMVVGFNVGIALMVAVGGRRSLFDPTPWSQAWELFFSRQVQTGFWFALIGLFVVNFVIQVSHKIGPGVALNWLLGRYHKPKQEERFFMFLDIKDSTPLAERLGNERFSLFVRDFFDDMTYPLIKTRAEVSHYIGDEVVVSWRIPYGQRNQNALRLFGLVREAIEARREQYLREFGEMPRFKAGLHVGRVVATDVGGLKSEIVFHGDVLNTTARVVGLCGSLGEDFLLTDEAAQLLPGPIQTVALGEFELKGKAEPVAISAVRLHPTP